MQKSTPKTMKLKKLSAIFLSVLMICAFTVPFSSVSAATMPNFSVTATVAPYTATSSSSVTLPMTVTITNSTGTPVEITEISVSGNFSGNVTPEAAIKNIANGSTQSYTFNTSFSGRNTTANITIKSKGNADYYLPTTITTVIPYSNLGGGTGTPDGDTATAVDPKPYVFSMDTTVFQAGDIVPVSMKLSTMEGYADDVRMKIVGPEGAETKFGFYSQTGWMTIGNMSEQMSINPYIQISPSLADGTYAVTMLFEYTRDGVTRQNSSKLNFIIQGRSSDVLYVKSANFAKAEIGKDNKSNLVVNVSNPTAGNFTDVMISFNLAASKGFSLVDTKRSYSVKEIAANSNKSVSFPMYIDSSTVTGNYPITFDMSYKDGTGTVITSSEQVYVQVTRSKDAAEPDKASTPRIIVSKYSTDTEFIKAGQSFKLEFALKNTSGTSAVGNVKVVLGSAVTSGTGTGAGSAGGAVFFPAQGSNSFFIQSIGTGAEATNSIQLMARQDVEPGVYPVMLKLDFEDSKGNPFSSEEQISFSVTQEQRLDIQAITMPTDAMMGGAIPVNFQYINKGKSTIFNLSVTVDGDFTLEGGSQYIGNLTAGFNDYFDNILLPSKEGALKGNIVLKFEDSNGDEQEQKLPITCNVSPASIDSGNMGGDMMGKPGGDGMMPVPQKSGGLLTKILWIGIPLLVIIVGVLAFLIIRKKRKAKKELVEDEED